MQSKYQNLGIVASQQGAEELGRFSIYTGEGKGKSTAALGVVLRSIGFGILKNAKHRVGLIRFLKGKDRSYDEDAAILAIQDRYPHLIDEVRFGRSEILSPEHLQSIDKEEAKRGWQVATGLILSGLYQVIVLDELNPLIDLGLLDVTEVISVLTQRPAHVEIIITGIKPSPQLMDLAELLSVHTPRSGEHPIPNVFFTTGPGKGKSTSSLGSALRAVGRSLTGADTLKVKVIQFLKGGPHGLYTEDAALAALCQIKPDLIEHERYGRSCIVFKTLPKGVDPIQARQQVDYAFAESGFWSFQEAILSGNYQLIVLDEIFPTLDLDLLPNGPSRLLELLQQKDPDVQVHLTGRCWETNPETQELLKVCASHTFIESRKHYSSQHSSRRPGIDQ